MKGDLGRMNSESDDLRCFVLSKYHLKALTGHMSQSFQMKDLVTCSCSDTIVISNFEVEFLKSGLPSLRPLTQER